MAGAQHESTPVPFSDAPTAKTGSQHESTDPLLRSMSSCLHRRLLAEDCSTKKLEDPRPLIPKVPAHIRETDSKAYSPQFISIGPCHHGHPRLQPAQDHKWRYTLHLLSRNLLSQNGNSDPLANNDDFSDELGKLIGSARDTEAWLRRCYLESTDDHMESDRFVEMMVLDGCFILEFLIKFYTRNREDPIFSVPWMLPLIRRDLLKLENQIPFFLLQRLFDLVRKPPTADGNPFPTLPEIAYIYLAFKRCPDVKSLSGTQIDHLLHLYDWTLLPPSGSPVICNDPKSSWFTRSLSLLHLSTSNSQIEKAKHSAATIPSASELRKAGVKFRRQSKEAESLLDINFKGNVLEVPQLSVVDGTNPIFRNLIALEQCCPDTKEPLPLKHFTSYALFWSCIVQTPEDVAILREQGIIENKLGSDQDIVRVLSQLFKEIIIDYGGHHFASLFRAVNSYYGSRKMKERSLWPPCMVILAFQRQDEGKHGLKRKIWKGFTF